MRRKKFYNYKRNKLEDIFINLTPLIDVVFVVLVAFILIAPLLEVDNIALATATESSQKDISKSKIIIYVREDDSVWINNRVVSDKELLSVLQFVKKENPGFVPQLYHHKKACFGTYQIVKGAIEKAGFESLDVILQGH